MKMLPLLLMSAAAQGIAATMERPNIIFFLVDDMGWNETSVPFWERPTALNHRYRTPNMERLAERGVKFTNAYACAISSPSRCSLLSGMNAARHRVTNWTLEKDQSTDAHSDTFEVPQWNINGIQPANDTARIARATYITALPEILRENGYYTIHCGKAHFGARHTTGENPKAFGFDVNIAGGANGAPGSYLAEEDYGKGRFHVEGLEQYYEKGTFLTEALTLEALKALQVPVERHQPFFLYMSQYAIHVPYDADKRFTSHYMTPDGKGRYDEQIGAPLNRMEINHAALIEGMDKSLGDLMNYLDAHPQVARNTIIIFMSDNGGQGISVRQGRQNYDQNYPLRAGKGSAYLGGVREPMIVCWPGVTHGGNVNKNRVMIEDFYPTILDMAKIKHYKTVQKIDGKSFADLLRDPTKSRERNIVFHYPNLWTVNMDENEGYGPYSALLDGRYHLIHFWDTGVTRLFDTENDIAERHDLAEKKPKLTQKLMRKLLKKLKYYHAQMPKTVKGEKM